MLGYDDGCHLKPFAQNPERLATASDLAKKSLTKDVDFAVDFFHFRENHTGAYCMRETNPHKYPVLTDPRNQVNMSIAEQSFKYVARFKHAFRYMNYRRFNFMLLLVCWLRQEVLKR
jgi:hypothetical protein